MYIQVIGGKGTDKRFERLIETGSRDRRSRLIGQNEPRESFIRPLSTDNRLIRCFWKCCT
jgi:hypothetical protein